MDNKSSQSKPVCSRNQSGCASHLSEKISQNSALFTLGGAVEQRPEGGGGVVPLVLLPVSHLAFLQVIPFRRPLSSGK